MFALECAMDELADAAGHRPGRAAASRNEPQTDPETGTPFSSRHLVELPAPRAPSVRLGRAATRGPACAATGDWLVGTGVAVARPTRSSSCRRRAAADGAARRPLRGRRSTPPTSAPARAPSSPQIAADALRRAGRRASRVDIGDSDLPGRVGGRRLGRARPPGAGRSARPAGRCCAGQPTADVADDGAEAEDSDGRRRRLARHAFGAQFAEVRVDLDSGEVRVAADARRLRGRPHPQPAHRPLPAARRHDDGPVAWRCTSAASLDPRIGDYVNHDLAEYHVPAYADVADVQARLARRAGRRTSTPMGAKGIGEIGIVGTAAAVANAVRHATGCACATCRSRRTRCWPACPIGELSRRARPGRASRGTARGRRAAPLARPGAPARSRTLTAPSSTAAPSPRPGRPPSTPGPRTARRPRA